MILRRARRRDVPHRGHAERPGADLIGLESIGEHLIADRGDEVADWSSTPVVADFGTGWRLSRQNRAEAEQQPDFAALFPVDGEDDAWNLTPAPPQRCTRRWACSPTRLTTMSRNTATTPLPPATEVTGRSSTGYPASPGGRT
jgi:hypothetical protein